MVNFATTKRMAMTYSFKHPIYKNLHTSGDAKPTVYFFDIPRLSGTNLSTKIMVAIRIHVYKSSASSLEPANHMAHPVWFSGTQGVFNEYTLHFACQPARSHQLYCQKQSDTGGFGVLKKFLTYEEDDVLVGQVAVFNPDAPVPDDTRLTSYITICRHLAKEPSEVSGVLRVQLEEVCKDPSMIIYWDVAARPAFIPLSSTAERISTMIKPLGRSADVIQIEDPYDEDLPDVNDGPLADDDLPPTNVFVLLDDQNRRQHEEAERETLEAECLRKEIEERERLLLKIREDLVAKQTSVKRNLDAAAWGETYLKQCEETREEVYAAEREVEKGVSGAAELIANLKEQSKFFPEDKRKEFVDNIDTMYVIPAVEAKRKRRIDSKIKLAEMEAGAAALIKR